MTTPNPPITPGPEQPYQLGDVMPAPQPRRSRAPWIIAGVAVLLAIGGAVAAVVAIDQDAEQPAASASPSTSTCARYAVDSGGAVFCGDGAAPAATQGPTYAVPTKADFTLGIKVLKKECFGSAGCNITFRLQVEYSKAFDPATTYEVTYEIRGGEDPLQNTFTVNGDQAMGEVEEFISTKTSKSKLTAVVLDVSER